MPEDTNEPREKFEISPTLIVGLGGTGYKTVIKVKQRLKDTYGDLKLPVRFLVFDLDDRVQPDVSLEEQEVLDKPEFKRLSVDSSVIEPDVLPSHPQLDWFPAEYNVKPAAGERGAGMIRPWGRLALFRSYNDVKTPLDDALDDILDAPSNITLGNQNVSVKDEIHVYVVGSICGGTGAGIFLDVPYLIHSYLYDRRASARARLYGLIGLPDLFNLSAKDTKRVEANAYAALKELDFLMDINNFQGDEFTQINYGSDRADWDTQRRPYDNIYLINRSGDQARGMLTEFSHLAELMSEFIFQMSISRMTALIHSSELVNGQANIVRLQNSPAGSLFPAYSSFGISSICFRSPDIAEYCRYRLADDIMDQLLYTNQSEDFFEEQMRSFSRQIEENHCLELPTMELETLDFYQLSYGELVASMENWFGEVKEGRRCIFELDQVEIAQARFDELLAQRVNQLFDSVDYGLEFTRLFLEKLRERFAKVQAQLEDRIEKRRADFSTEAKDAELENYANIIGRAIDANISEGERNDIREHNIQRYVDRVERLFETRYKPHILDERNLELYTVLIDKVDSQQQRVKGFLKRLNDIEDDFADKEEEYLKKIFPKGGQTLILNQPLLESEEKLVDYFNSFLIKDEVEGGTDIRRRVQLLIDELKQENRLGNFASWLTRYQDEYIKEKIEEIAMEPFADIPNITIAEAIMSLGTQERTRRVQDLLDFSTIHFIKDTRYLQNAEGFISTADWIGLHDGANDSQRQAVTQLKEEISQLESGWQDALIEDAYTLLVIRGGYLIPLGGLASIGDLKEAYEDLQDQYPLHLIKEGKFAPELVFSNEDPVVGKRCERCDRSVYLNQSVDICPICRAVEMYNTKECINPDCPQKRIPLEAKICPYCGTKQIKEKPKTHEICPKCGEKSPLGSRFCMHCGYEFSQEADSPE